MGIKPEFSAQIIVCLIMQVLVIVFGALAHANYQWKLEKSSTVPADSHGGIWKTCQGSSCKSFGSEDVGDESWRQIQTARTFLIVSHVTGALVLAELGLAMLGVIGDRLRVVSHAVAATLQALCLMFSGSMASAAFLGLEFAWAAILMWVGVILAALLLPAGCVQLDAHGKQIQDEDEEEVKTDAV